MSQIKERPILFSAPMVRAILDGRKTVTRRPMKGSALKWLEEFVPEFVSHSANGLCPFGRPGERLWVREAFGLQVRHYGGGTGEHIVYRATNPNAIYCKSAEGREYPVKWKPSIHMPRHSSRILLEITDVRVERLQDITYEQAAAEGVHRGPLREWCASDEGGACHKYPIPAFRDLWQSTGGDWDANPWVWCVSFRRVDP
ncbi:hypothetical protein PSH90_12055 [Pseudomonas sp. FP1762]|uniref:hypothetical protein n=1 Tax=Pseudomonas sp. FP1762 TaxID=2954080 RepID=UPI00273479F5|nr:hypothetical protein [Pseudomonas sp. FP1762]WLG64798.1 hypothetical protein PSH90_12055 [Pseudomonas sp. FP1762]